MIPGLDLAYAVYVHYVGAVHARKALFANDVAGRELRAVSCAQNQAKGDSTPEAWMPPNTGGLVQLHDRLGHGESPMATRGDPSRTRPPRHRALQLLTGDEHQTRPQAQDRHRRGGRGPVGAEGTQRTGGRQTATDCDSLVVAGAPTACRNVIASVVGPAAKNFRGPLEVGLAHPV